MRVSPVKDDSQTGSWYAVIMLALIFLVAYLDRSIISLLVIPIQNDIEVSDTQMGLLQGAAFVIPYALAGFPIGRLADRASRRRIIGASVIVWSLMTAVSGLSTRYVHLLLARIGV